MHVARAAAAPHLLHQREDDREDADVEQQVGDRDPVLDRQEISLKLSFHIASRSVAFNKEKALVGAFFGNCETSERFVHSTTG